MGDLLKLALATTMCATAGFAEAVLPLKGVVLWCDQAAAHPELKDAIALEFAYVKPSVVTKGMTDKFVFDWAPYDRLLAGAASRGHQLVLRPRYEYPGEDGGKTAVPKCVKESPGYTETFTANPGGDGPTYYADWSSPLLQRFTLEFFKALAARYDGDPRLGFIEVGFGHWSEYHIYGTKLKLGKNFPDKSFQKRFLSSLGGWFHETPYLISIDAADRGYSPIVGDQAMLNLGFGLFDDSFMHAKHDLSQGDGYNEKCWRAMGRDRWKRAPCGGEISYYSKRDQREFLSPKGVHGVTWKVAAAKYHMTFVIANDSLDGRYASASRLRQASEECGWNCRVLRKVVKSGGCEVELENSGVAPIYHDVRVRCGGETSSVSLRGLLPGEQRTVFFGSVGRIELVSRKFLAPFALE